MHCVRCSTGLPAFIPWDSCQTCTCMDMDPNTLTRTKAYLTSLDLYLLSVMSFIWHPAPSALYCNYSHYCRQPASSVYPGVKCVNMRCSSHRCCRNLGRDSPNSKQVFRTISLHVSITFFLCFPKLEGI
jgi:hypothetical protein